MLKMPKSKKLNDNVMFLFETFLFAFIQVMIKINDMCILLLYVKVTVQL